METKHKRKKESWGGKIALVAANKNKPQVKKRKEMQTFEKRESQDPP